MLYHPYPSYSGKPKPTTPIRVEGRFNRTKCKLFLFLQAIRKRNNDYLTCLQVHKATEISYGYLRNRMPLFSRWKRPYLNKKFNEKGATVYRLSQRGVDWLDRVDLMVRNALTTELNQVFAHHAQEEQKVRDAIWAAFRERQAQRQRDIQANIQRAIRELTAQEVQQER